MKWIINQYSLCKQSLGDGCSLAGVGYKDGFLKGSFLCAFQIYEKHNKIDHMWENFKFSIRLRHHVVIFTYLNITSIPFLLLEYFCEQRGPIHVCLIYQSKPVLFRFSAIMWLYPTHSENQAPKPMKVGREDLPVSGTSVPWKKKMTEAPLPPAQGKEIVKKWK